MSRMSNYVFESVTSECQSTGCVYDYDVMASAVLDQCYIVSYGSQGKNLKRLIVIFIPKVSSYAAHSECQCSDLT